MTRESASRAPGRRPRPDHATPPPARLRPGDLGVLGWLAPLILALVILFAPAGSTYWWGVNTLRSLESPAPAAVVLVSLAMAGIAFVSLRNPIVRWLSALAIAACVAFPLRETIHYLGDSQLRFRSLVMVGAGALPAVGSWWTRLHLNPLDVLVNILAVAGLQRLGLSAAHSVSLVSSVLGLLFLAVCWRLAGRLSSDAGARWGLTAALALSGVLEAFAGLTESAGLVAVATTWWWAEALRPLDRKAQAWRMAAAFVALSLSHRIGIVMVVPLLWRALGPPFERDLPTARRWLLVLGAVVVAALAATFVATGSGAQMLRDLGDLANGIRTGHARPSDVLNLLVLVSPLALLAPFVAGRTATAAWLRSREAALLLVIAVPLALILMLAFPAVPTTLGSERDWDASLLSGVTLTVAGAAILGRLHPARRRNALAVVLPVLGLCAFSWLAANHDETAAMRRAFAMAERPSTLTPLQAGYLHAFLGQRALDQGQAAIGGQQFERAFEVGGSARRALQASEAWLAAGQPVAARRALAKALTRGPLGPELEDIAHRLDAMIAQALADTTAGQPAAGGR